MGALVTCGYFYYEKTDEGFKIITLCVKEALEKLVLKPIAVLHFINRRQCEHIVPLGAGWVEKSANIVTTIVGGPQGTGKLTLVHNEILCIFDRLFFLGFGS